MARSNGRFAKAAPASDPATAANQRILADRQARIDQKEAEKTLSSDLGLDIKPPVSQADNAVDFLSDEWDRKTFGDSIPTFTRIVYGPDPLLISCPEMKAGIEKAGLEVYAMTAAETILLRQENALTDPILQRGLRNAIAKFGVESVADAFRQRIMKIPQRTVEVEADRSDAMIFAKPMEEAVQRYGTPGMSAKFLSDRCMGVLGLRGYVIVKDEQGDPVRVGTLIMGQIPERMAAARRRHFAEESNKQVREQAEEFEETAARAIRNNGGRGFSVLSEGDKVHANASEEEAFVGHSFETGFSVERQK